MATVENLVGWNVAAVKGTETEMRDGEPHAVEAWRLIFMETVPPSGNQIVFSMRKDTRDELVRQLTGGIVLSGGELPKL